MSLGLEARTYPVTVPSSPWQTNSKLSGPDDSCEGENSLLLSQERRISLLPFPSGKGSTLSSGGFAALHPSLPTVAFVL